MNRQFITVAIGLIALVAVGSLGAVGGGQANGQSVPLIAGAAGWELMACAAASLILALSMSRLPVTAAAALVVGSCLLAGQLVVDFRQNIVFDGALTAPFALVVITALACAGLARYGRFSGPLAHSASSAGL